LASISSTAQLVASDAADTVDDLAGDELDARARALVAELHRPSAAIFWIDLVACAGVGWTAFWLSLSLNPLTLAGAGMGAVAALVLYRGLCFTHEISHMRRGAVPMFETAWNILFGVPLLLPTITYLGVHPAHHNIATYGTRADPEYLPFARSRRLMTVFGLQSAFLLPFLLMLRFLLLSPLGLLWPRFHAGLEKYASSFSMNPLYERQVSPAMARKMRIWEGVILAAWSVPVTLLVMGVLSPRFIYQWIGVMTLVCLLNTLRVLAAHEYESDGHAGDRHWQLRDSIDSPGGPWTTLWAPVGLRYHALHHYFPGIPYHNLGAAYRRLTRELPKELGYARSSRPSLWYSLHDLWERAKRRGEALATFWW